MGPDGLLGEFTKQVPEAGSEITLEMYGHLGYEKHAVGGCRPPVGRGRDGGNSRNGTRSKAVITELDPVEIATAARTEDGAQTATPAT